MDEQTNPAMTTNAINALAKLANVQNSDVFVGRIGGDRPPAYRLRVTWRNETHDIDDPYAFPPLLSDFDLHLFTEGKLYRAYDFFGAHVRTVDGIPGVQFAVWAPNAVRVSIA